MKRLLAAALALTVGCSTPRVAFTTFTPIQPVRTSTWTPPAVDLDLDLDFSEAQVCGVEGEAFICLPVDQAERLLDHVERRWPAVIGLVREYETREALHQATERKLAEQLTATSSVALTIQAERDSIQPTEIWKWASVGLGGVVVGVLTSILLR